MDGGGGRGGGAALAVLVVEEDGAAASGVAGVDVAPAVADDEAGGEVDLMAGGACEHESGLGFAAGAIVFVVVIADDEIVEGEGGAEEIVNLFDGGLGLAAAGDVGLVGDDDEEEAGGAETVEGFGGAGEDLHFGSGGGRVGAAIADDGAVEDAVAIEEYGFGHGLDSLELGDAADFDPFGDVDIAVGGEAGRVGGDEAAGGEGGAGRGAEAFVGLAVGLAAVA